MQTFLHYPDFKQTAKCLDYRRLGKQRVEAFQLINILEGKTKSKAWQQHPALLMWNGYVDTLKLYHDIMIAEWIRRGYNNNMQLYCGNILLQTLLTEDYQFSGNFEIPQWLTEDFCSRHRAALLYKDYDYYSRFGWKEKPELNYKWGD